MAGTLRAVALVSGIYDALSGRRVLVGRDMLVRGFGVTAPSPPIHADLNGLFALAIAVGYCCPTAIRSATAAYLWVMGPLLKGAGAALFVADYILRGSPASFLSSPPATARSRSSRCGRCSRSDR